ncbi:MAG: phosphate ABC transporter permease PstA [Gaiellaceae bacterium]
MEASGIVPISLKSTGRSRRRQRRNQVAQGASIFAAFLAIGVLALVVISVLVRGLKALNLDLFTKNQVTFGETGGGIANGLVGTAIMVAIATAIALPVGILAAVYVAEFSGNQAARVVRLALDVLNGVPSIVVGIFAYALLVVGSGYAAWKASVALAIVMLPLVARTTIEVLRLVPDALRYGSYALGISKWRTVLFVVMPSAIGSIMTGATLAVARAAGETAPLLFTTSIFLPNQIETDPHHAMAAVPLLILFDSESPDPSLNNQAWAAAFVLMIFVLVLSLSARYVLARRERKLRAR